MNKWTNDTINQQLYVKINDIIFFLINGLYFDKHTQPHRFKCDLYVNNAKVFISVTWVETFADINYYMLCFQVV